MATAAIKLLKGYIYITYGLNFNKPGSNDHIYFHSVKGSKQML